MTQTEKLALRLAQFPGRLVRITAFIDSNGALMFWVLNDDLKVEGINGNTQQEKQPEIEHAY